MENEVTLQDKLRKLAPVLQASAFFPAVRLIHQAADMIDKLISTGPRWRHQKRGSFYTEVGRGHLQMDQPPKDMDPVVIYRGDDGSLWCRPVAEFEDGRFERSPEP